ncbi:SDR family NAD(P)-dependent oxidoreductase [Microvirga antarctica]|uniref:SDR family NAD(P)-dependent oxidoreductase n=1 Tax=Microvirga antarctica TaxID=2819233 RepID=UPI001B313A89|nr:SDR family oxidoreductase [Microvirga antarctica]
MQNLADKVVLVTGASKGIGSAIARALGEAGARVIAQYGSDLAGAQSATSDIPEDRKMLLQADLSDMGAVEALWSAALGWRGRIDVVVNNAAVMLWDGGIDEDDAAWDRVWSETLQVNVLAPARILRNAVRHFRQSKGGIIITISSWSAQRGSTDPDTIAYAASKAAIKAATQTLARGYAKENIFTYVVAPGVVQTQMSENFAASQGGAAAVNSSLAMGEWVPPREIAALVTFLASGECRHLSGATLDVNGASYVR